MVIFDGWMILWDEIVEKSLTHQKCEDHLRLFLPPRNTMNSQALDSHHLPSLPFILWLISNLSATCCSSDWREGENNYQASNMRFWMKKKVAALPWEVSEEEEEKRRDVGMKWFPLTLIQILLKEGDCYPIICHEFFILYSSLILSCEMWSRSDLNGQECSCDYFKRWSVHELK